jgi:hypothetical protein
MVKIYWLEGMVQPLKDSETSTTHFIISQIICLLFAMLERHFYFQVFAVWEPCWIFMEVQ